jgi:hypothetical protein
MAHQIGQTLMGICLVVAVADIFTAKPSARAGNGIGAPVSVTRSAIPEGLPQWAIARLGRTSLRHRGAARAVAFAPDGKALASGGDDGRVHLWDRATGKELCRLTGHTGAVLAVAFSGEGNRLASGSCDNTIRLWDVASGAEVGRFSGPSNGIQTVAFSPDGKSVAAAGAGTEVLVWDLPPVNFPRGSGIPGHGGTPARQAADSPATARSLARGSKGASLGQGPYPAGQPAAATKGKKRQSIYNEALWRKIH